MTLNVVIPKLNNFDPEEVDKCRKAVLNQWISDVRIRLIEEEGTDYQEAFNKAIDGVSEGYILFLFPWVVLKDKALKYTDFFSASGESADIRIWGYEAICWNKPGYVSFSQKEYPVKDFALELHKHPGDVAYTSLWNKIMSVELIKRNRVRFRHEFREEFQYRFLLEYLECCSKVMITDSCLATVYIKAQPEMPEKDRVREKIGLLNQYRHLLEKVAGSEKAAEIVDKEYLDYYVYERIRLATTVVSDKKAARDLLDITKNRINKKNYAVDVVLKCRVLKGYLGRIKYYLIYERKNKSGRRKRVSAESREAYFEKNFYKFRRPARILHRCLGVDKWILLYCESPTMKPHIMDFYQCIKKMPGIRCFIYYPDAWDTEVPLGVSLVKKRSAALNMPWDMLVCADVSVPLYYHKHEAKIVYINHGLHMISYDCGNNLYAYDKGKGLFSAMLEPNKSYAEIMSKQLPDERIYHVGYKNAESIFAEKQNRDKYRHQLGYSKDDIVVAVFGTWGIDSLFHRVGDALIEQARDMIKDNYKFILSIHPKEYASYDESVEPLGEYIESLSAQGFLIRSPNESSIKYIVAADVVICDYSTLCEEAMLAGKPVILSDFPMERVWNRSIIAKYKERGLVFGTSDNLRALITTGMKDNSLQSYAGLLTEDLIPPNGGYRKNVIKAIREILDVE